jgi:hypothetical protein
MRKRPPIKREQLIAFRVRKLLIWQHRNHGCLTDETLAALQNSPVWQSWGYATFAECLADEYQMSPPPAVKGETI